VICWDRGRPRPQMSAKRELRVCGAFAGGGARGPSNHLSLFIPESCLEAGSWVTNSKQTQFELAIVKRFERARVRNRI